MKKIVLTAAALTAASSFAAELVVSPTAGKDGYTSINKAFAAAQPGDTVLVKGGVYAETLMLGREFPSEPVTLKAAPGERVVLSGFAAIEGWKDEGGGVYSARVPSEVDALFLGFRELQCARWPADGTRLPIRTADSATRTFKTEPVADARLAELAKDPKSAVCFYFFAAGNAFGSPAIESYDAKTGDIRFDEKNWNRWIKPDNNRYSFMNHPALIAEPGSWAFVADVKGDRKNTAGTVYFKPGQKADLAKTRYRARKRPMVQFGIHKGKASNIVLDGFEITGSADVGIRVGAEDVTIRNCLVHRNGKGGIAVRCAKRVNILSNLVLANGGNGVGLASVDDARVEGNEIAFHQADGLVVAGNISGRKPGTPGANPPTRDVTVRRNYIHHHYLQAHPDNIQMYRDVANVKFEENFNVWGGQSLMAEEADDIVLKGNVVMGCEAVMLICGHGNSNRWKFENNTLWGSGYGFFSFTGRDYEVTRNLLIGGAMSYASTDRNVKSRTNRFAPAYSGRTERPWRKYTSLATAQKEIGQEEGSSEGPAKQPNFPAAYAVGRANGNARDSIALRKDYAKTDKFAAGDRIELNGDGRLRTVTACRDGVLSFTPALPLPPFRGVMVFNWKDARSTVVETAPVDGCGASISTRAFVAGDLLGKGARTLPVLSADVAAASPDPNAPIIPWR